MGFTCLLTYMQTWEQSKESSSSNKTLINYYNTSNIIKSEQRRDAVISSHQVHHCAQPHRRI